MSLKNKALKQDAFKQGKISINDRNWNFSIQKDPLLFSNSDELRKIQNRNKKRK